MCWLSSPRTGTSLCTAPDAHRRSSFVVCSIPGIDRDVIGIRQFAALSAVAEQGSVAKAAESLQWSQPTVVHHLKGLERELGASVVSASPAGTVLTPVGCEMLPHARAVLARVERARHDVRGFAVDHKRRLRIGIFPTLAARLLPSLLVGLQARGYTIVVHEAEVDVLRAGLAELRIDAAVLYTTPSDARTTPVGFDARHMFSEPLVVMLPRAHRLASADHVELADLASEEWVLGAQRDEPLEQLLVSAARGAGFSPRPAARSDDYRVVAAYVSAGVGIALVPRSVVAPAETSLAVVPLASPGLTRRVQLITSATMNPDAVEALVSTIAQAHAVTGLASDSLPE